MIVDKRHAVRVTFDDGDHLTSTVNGTADEVVRYYLGNRFNVGIGPEDNVRVATKVEFLEGVDMQTVEQDRRELLAAWKRDVADNATELGFEDWIQDRKEAAEDRRFKIRARAGEAARWLWVMSSGAMTTDENAAYIFPEDEAERALTTFTTFAPTWTFEKVPV